MTARVRLLTTALLAALLGCRAGHAPEPQGAPAEVRRAGSPQGETSMPRAPLADVLARHTPELMKLPGVNGTGEGRDANEPVLVVFAIRDDPALRARLPRTIEGYRVVVRVTGTVRARN